MIERVFENVSTVSIQSGPGSCRVVLGIPEAPPPVPTDAITTVKDLQMALNDGAPDITLSGILTVTPETAITIPRNITRSIRGAAMIQGTGQDFRLVSAPGRGGELHLYDFTIDGGWLKNPGECPDDRAANLFLPDFDVLTLASVKTQFSRRTGIFASNTGRLAVQKCEFYALPRDGIWCNDSRRVLVEDCLVTHCCDDGIGCHASSGRPGADEIIVRRNTLRATLGMKFLNRNVLAENNTLIGCHFYGIRLGQDKDPPCEGDSARPDNIIIRGNTIENVQLTSRCHPGQEGGVWLWLFAPNRRIGDVQYVENTLIRNIADDGAKIASVYPWASEGYYTKTGFDPAGVLDIGREAIRTVCANPNGIETARNNLKGF